MTVPRNLAPISPSPSSKLATPSTTGVFFSPGNSFVVSRFWILSFAVCFLVAGAEDLRAEDVPETVTKVASMRSIKKSIRTEKDVVFQQAAGEEVRADLYRPQSNERLPIVIMIHGGAWMAGDKWNVIDHAIQMAESGFVVMAINYRLAPAHRWPAQREDCQAALKWIAEHHAKWNADTDRVGVWGYSAGGHLALMISLDPQPHLPRVKACVAGGPPCDLDFIPLHSRMLASFLGGSREQFPDRYREASPIHLLSPDDPPLYIFHGEDDSIVPIENSQKLHRKSVELGMTTDYRTVSQLGHLMTFIDRQSRLEAIDFLKKHLVPSTR